MGRRILGGILAGLALLVQLMLPAAASRIDAHISDPFGHILICAPDSDPGTDNPQGDGPPHHTHCSLCQIAFANSALFDTRSVSIAAPVSGPCSIAWTVPGNGPSIFGIDRQEPPRGPPFLI